VKRVAPESRDAARARDVIAKAPSSRWKRASGTTAMISS